MIFNSYVIGSEFMRCPVPKKRIVPTRGVVVYDNTYNAMPNSLERKMLLALSSIFVLHLTSMRNFILIFFSFSSFCVHTQSAYWQQQVDYTIKVSLNDTLNELDGYITIDYKNNSPQTLTYIYFQLWPNAYKDQTTPFARQMLENGNTSFWYSKPDQHGYLDSIKFKLDGEDCASQFDPGSYEICKVLLNKPLPTGASVRITTPFHVKIPETFSRMGHVGQSYQISQWYPKPAVYDKYGWHPMPYLDQGEFYSEFGSFNVTITLPANYVVGATGDLQDTTEINWMNARADANQRNGNLKNGGDMRSPPSSTRLKIIHFKQNHIHDFAWFADKRFHVLKGEVELPGSKQIVTTWALFTNHKAKYWSKAPEYIHDAILNYSQWVGDYPYKQVTAVDGALAAGGGMEYPNVTVIGDVGSDVELDEVITHEVGHNWFYGMLGTNERDHAWMDEGINSYYEYRYMAQKYPNYKLTGNILGKRLAKFFDLYQYNHKYEADLGYQFMARENNDEPIEQTSSKFTTLNYGIEVYGKTMLIFGYLEAYLGTPVFDRTMKKYFEEWKYKHPQPEDIRRIFETETGKDLSWFFDDLLKTTKKIDYKIKSVSSDEQNLSLTIKNANQISSPVQVALMKGDSVISSQWIDGFTGTKTISIAKGDADKIQIDPGLVIPEINRKNNTYKLYRPAHKFQTLRLQFLGSIEDQKRTQVFFSPYVGWNNYDKTQVGLAFYNSFLPAEKFNYLLVPAFGTGSKQLIGFAKVNYNFYPKKIHNITIGLAGKRFSYLLFPADLTFNKLEPYLNMEFNRKNSRSDFSQSLHIRSVNAWLGLINSNGDTLAKQTEHYFINEAKYKLERNSRLNPFNIIVNAQQGKNFVNLSAEANFRISYRPKNDGLTIRIFTGGFLFDNKSSSDITAPDPRFYLSNVTNNTYAYWLQKDYMFDENFIDRNGRNDILARQVALTGGGFRSITNIGATRKYMASTNFSSTIYKSFPIQPFASLAATVDDYNKINVEAELGLSLVVIRHIAEFNLPLFVTNNILNDQQANGITKWYQRITFTLKLQLPETKDLLRYFSGN